MNKWIAGARPKTLPAAIAPVAVGTALAGENFDPLLALRYLFEARALAKSAEDVSAISFGAPVLQINISKPIRAIHGHCCCL